MADNADLIAVARKEATALGMMRIGNPATIERLADALEAAEARLAALTSDEAVRRAVRAHRAPRLHVNDTVIDREIDMRAALSAARGDGGEG